MKPHQSGLIRMFAAALTLFLTTGLFAERPVSSEWFAVSSILSHEDAFSRAHDVALSGDLAFVPGKGGSIAIVNVADPADPKLLWHRRDMEALTDAETVLPLGHHLLLGTCDFLSIDVSNPASPKILKKITDRKNGRIDRINGMVKVGDIVFAANKSGWIDAFDVSDPADPTLFDTLNVKEAYGLTSPHDIDAFSDHIVIAEASGFGKSPFGKLAIFKVKGSDGRVLPADQWELLSKIQSPELIGANRVQVTGSFACVGGSQSPETRKDGKGPQFTVIDISDPRDARVVASLPFSDERGPNGLTIAGKVVFLAGGETIDAINLSDPRHPVRIGSGKLPASNISTKPNRRSDNAHDLVYRNGFLYVSCQSDDSFMILEVTDERIRKLADSTE